jgi:Flp pilus assembly protein TadD
MRSVFLTRLLLLLLVVAPAATRAQTAAPAKEISEAVGAKLADLRTLTDAKKFSEALALIDTLLVNAADPSFDLALLSQIRAQVLVAVGRYAEALPAFQKSYDLGERHAFFEPRVQLDNLYLLSQLHFQLGGDAKDRALQKSHYDAAYARVNEWLSRSPAPTAEARFFAATVLYTQATADPKVLDADLLRRARIEAEQSLYLQTKPAENARVLVLATQQQLNENREAADTLELLVEQAPTSTQYWQQLASLYLGLAADAKTEADARRQNLRSLLTLERAQARGLLSGPKENAIVVGLLFNLRQYDRAIEILEKGLASGAVENTRANWELLASAHQQQHRNDRAVAALGRAITVFPKDGQIESTLGQLHYALDQTEDARRHLEAAVTKGNLDQPGQTRFTLAYISYELRRLDEAAKWIEAAGAFPDVKPDDVARLARAIKEAREERAGFVSSKQKTPSQT